MKKLKLFGIAITVLMFMSSCGGSSANIDGGVLEDLPSIAGKTVDKLTGLVEDLESAKISADGDKYVKLEKEIETIKEQAETDMNTFIQTKEPFTIPFEQMIDNEVLTIKEVRLLPKSHINTRKTVKSTLVFEVSCLVVKKSKADPSLFLRFINSENEALEGYATLNYFGKSLRNMEPGTEIVFNGSFTGNVQNLVKVANVINISREEWNELRQKK